MPIPIYFLPTHIKTGIIQKLDFDNFRQFEASSRASHVIAKKIRTKFSISHVREEKICLEIKEGNIFLVRNGSTVSFDLIECHVRLKAASITIKEPLTEKLADRLCKIFYLTSSAAKLFKFSSIECSPEKLSKLMTIAKTEGAAFAETFASSSLEISALKETKFLEFHNSIENGDLKKIRAPRFNLLGTKVNSTGINMLLKELLSNQREIQRAFIEPLEGVQEDVLLNGIPYETIREKDEYGEFYYFLIGEKKNYRVDKCSHIALITRP